MIKWLKQKYNELKTSLVLRSLDNQLNKEIETNVNMHEANIEVQSEATSRKYENGLTLAKTRMRDRIKNGGEASARGLDMTELSSNPLDDSTRLRRDIYINKVKDIKSPEDHAKMIDKRINAMYALQNNIEKRTLSRQIRKAKATGNTEKYNRLMAEWEKKYVRTKN